MTIVLGAVSGCPEPVLTDFGPAASRHTMPQLATPGLHLVIHVPNYVDYY